MKIITGPESEQGSEAWLRFRKDRIGASEAAAIMGIDPWMTPYQSWRRKLELDPPIEENLAMRRGKELEPIAREHFNNIGGVKFMPAVVVHSEYPWMMASLDGLNETYSNSIEIKCAGQKDHQIALSGNIPEKYYPQLQHQMAVTGHATMWYISFDGENVVSTVVQRDDEYIAKLIEAEKEFKRCLDTLTPPPLTEKDYVQREDEEWIMYSHWYQYEKKRMEEAKKNMENYREKLLELSNGQNTKGCGVTVQKIVSKGRVDYNRMVDDLQIDVEKYRKEKTETWRIDLND